MLQLEAAVGGAGDVCSSRRCDQAGGRRRGPNTLRDLLIRIAQAGLVQARWTSKILDEMIAALARNRPDIEPGKLDRLRQLMTSAIRDCLITGYEPLIDELKLPDPDDRHVLAAATKSPDDFVLDQVGIHAQTVAACVQQIADSRLWWVPPCGG